MHSVGDEQRAGRVPRPVLRGSNGLMATLTMSRDNQTWLRQLRAEGSEQHGALSDLRAELLRGLRRAFANWASVDDSFLEDAVQDSLEIGRASCRERV